MKLWNVYCWLGKLKQWSVLCFIASFQCFFVPALSMRNVWLYLSNEDVSKMGPSVLSSAWFLPFIFKYLILSTYSLGSSMNYYLIINYTSMMSYSWPFTSYRYFGFPLYVTCMIKMYTSLGRNWYCSFVGVLDVYIFLKGHHLGFCVKEVVKR